MITLSQPTSLSAATAGFVDVAVNQRFWNDERLSRVNGFSEWGALGVDAAVGFAELPWQIKPYASFGFIRDTANLPLLNPDGSNVVDENGNTSTDRLQYTFLSAGLGFKQRFWRPEFFWLIPFYRVGAIYRFGWVKKLTEAVDQQTKSSGGDLGLELGGGFILSFFYDRAIKSDMTTTWNLTDFGLIFQARYLPGDWFRHGLGEIAGTSGWDFGLGLALDW